MDKVMEQILAEEATAPNQFEYRLALMAESDNSLEGYITAWNMSKDTLMKNNHFQRALDFVRQHPSRINYLRGYTFCRDIGKTEVASELGTEMRSRYPIVSAINILAIRLTGLFR